MPILAIVNAPEPPDAADQPRPFAGQRMLDNPPMVTVRVNKRARPQYSGMDEPQAAYADDMAR